MGQHDCDDRDRARLLEGSWITSVGRTEISSEIGETHENLENEFDSSSLLK